VTLIVDVARSHARHSAPPRFARVVMAVCVVAMLATGCKTAPGSFYQKFGVDPGSARITQFYFSGLGMDHAYLWVIEPVDDTLIDAVVKAAGLVPRKDLFEGSSLISDFPPWWDSDTIEQLPEGYFRDGDRQFWRVWIDRRSNRIHAQWFDT
jgi:hypothetical protein